jgi:GntR family transcriptional regulator, transcriptional repressor for pyruvate dehydrogenase complex
VKLSMAKQATTRNVKNDSRAETVRSGIERLIVERQLRPGDRLPSERELADDFGVSRTLVREAVHSLVARTLLEVKPGSGIVVRLPSRQSVVQSVATFFQVGHPQLDPRKIFEVRRVLEVEVAGIAAERRSLEDLERLGRILTEMPNLKRDAEAFAQHDVNFHSMLAQATHNELFVLMNESIHDILYKVRQLGGVVPGSRDKAIKFHETIFKKVRAGDPPAAREAMLAHLEDAEATFIKGLATVSKRKS